MTISRESRSAGERGSALIIALVATVLLTALGLGLVMLTDTEGAIASNYRAGNQTLYAADAAVERVMADILLTPSWNDILQGNLQSAFIDSTLTPTLFSGQQVSLTSMTAEVQAQSDASSPWGANNPQWRLFAYGPIATMAGSSNVVQRPEYVAVWVSDDPAETDNNPQSDTNGVITVLARAFGPYGTQRSIEVTLAKTDLTEIERGQIAQRGQEELNQRARKAAVQLPGKTLTAMDMNVASGGMVIR
jgi:Tfp pilus assembly protein PilX